MKKFFIILTILIIGLSSYAEKSKQASVIPDEQLAYMSITIDHITEKIYGGSFLSPSDTKALISVKIKLDDNMLISPESQYEPLYYKLGKVYQIRGEKREAIECYQSIIENFSDTALAPKAAQELKKMGINVVLPEKTNTETEEE